jgi:hypothetical protein
VRRSTDFSGDTFYWDEYLLFSEGLGYRWLVKDERSWMWVMPVNLADLDLANMPGSVSWQKKRFSVRNTSPATVEYVLGEVYWKCEVGETTRASDYVSGAEVLSREESPGEVKWSYSAPVPWSVIASGFGLPEDGPGGRFQPAASSGFDYGGGVSRSSSSISQVIFLVVLLFICTTAFNGGCGVLPIPILGGSGSYYGGK